MIRPTLRVAAAAVGVATLSAILWAQVPSDGGPPPERFYLRSDQTIPVNGKGGSNIMGPYVRAKNWPHLPDGRQIDSGPAIYAESPDRIYVGTRGTRSPYPIQVGWQRQTIMKWFHLTANDLDQRHDYILDVFDRQGNLIEHWKQYDTNFPIHAVQRWHVNVNDPHRYNYITGGHIIILSHDGKTVIKDIAPEDVPTPPGQTKFSPEGIAFAPDGGFWVASHTRLIRFSRDFKYVSEFGTPGDGPGQMLGIHDVIYDKVSHRLYVCDQYAHRVVVYDESGKLLDTWPNIISPSAIRMTRDRKYVWVGDIYAPRFYKFDLQGHMITSFGTWGIADGAISGIHDFDVDSEGNLYVANHDIQATEKFIPLKDGNPEQIIGPLMPR
jgi:hypothetical protein